MPQLLRVTIGGVEVNAPGTTASTGQARVAAPLSDGSDIPVLSQARASTPVKVFPNGWRLPLCPIPPGPWRLAGAVTIAAVLVAIIIALCPRPR